MARRGRKRAPTDNAAQEAQRSVAQYRKKYQISVAELSRRANVSESSAWRVINESPPRWVPTLTKLMEFVKLSNDNTVDSPNQAALVNRLAAVANGGGNPSTVTAALLRVVADLLDSSTGTNLSDRQR